MTEKPRVFISYAHEDEAYAHALRDKIELLGAASFEEPTEGLDSGSEWAKLIQSSLERASVFLLVVPNAGTMGANNAYFETGAARALGKRIFAVAPENRGLQGLATGLLDIAVIEGGRQSLEKVARTLAGALAA